MINGKKIRLRPWQEKDIEFFTGLRNNIHIQSQLLTIVRGSTCDQTRNWLDKRSTGSNSLFYVISDLKTNKANGFIQFTDINFHHQYAFLGICLSQENQGKGFGKEAIQIALKHLNCHFKIRKVVLKVRNDNFIAISCYEKLGFEKCGLMRNHVHMEGKYFDVVIMEIHLNDI